MELIPCRVVESSCLPTHNIVPHISWHDLPYHRTTKKYENSRSMEVFQFSPRKFVFQTWLCNCPQYLCLFHIVFECIPDKHDKRKMLVLPNRLLYFVLFNIGSMFCFLPANLISSTHTDKNNVFSRCTNKHSQLETFSHPCFKRMFSNYLFPQQSCQRMTTSLPYWTMILAICVVVDESKLLDIPIWEFSVILEHPPFLPGYEQILRLLLVLRNLVVWK